MRAIALSFTLAGGWLLSGLSARAQVIPDATVNTIVTPSGSTFTIDGGTMAGTNLFHSFSEFSVPTGSEAFFNNAASIDNILSRVTGGSISNIDGLIRANGTANLFLLNPNGIIFGPNASLDIGGSFISTSAETVEFADGVEFSSTDTSSAPLLSVSVPVGLQLGNAPGNIINRSTDMSVPGDRTLALIGGKVTLEGATLTTLGGRVELGGVGENQTVNLNPTEDGFALNYDGISDFRDLDLFGDPVATLIDTSNYDDRANGPVQLQGRNIRLRPQATIFALSSSTEDAPPITLNASETVSVVGAGDFIEGVISTGPANDFGSPDLFLTGVYSTADSEGVGPNIEVNAPVVEVLEAAFMAAVSRQGRAGNVVVNASELVDLQLTQLGSYTRPGSIDGSGNVIVNTSRLVMREIGTLGASTGNEAPGGNAIVNASESVEIIGTEFLRFGDDAAVSGILMDGFGTGDTGDAIVTTARLTIIDGGGIVTAGSAQGRPGNIIVNAGIVELIGRTPDPDVMFPSSLSTLPREDLEGTGGGNITVVADELIARDGGGIFIDNIRPGDGGSIDITANTIRLENGGTIEAETAFGEGANINLDIRNLHLHDSQILTGVGIASRRSLTVEGIPGDGGNISINADRTIATGNSRIVTVGNIDETLNSNDVLTGGNIDIDTRVLRVRDGSSIVTSNLTAGEGGNVSISARRVLLNDGSVATETVFGEGSNIDIEARNTRLLNGSQINTIVGRATDPVSGLGVVGMGGDGGNISIDTNALIAFGNSDIFTDVLSGDGGQIDIDARAIVGAEFREGLTPFSDIATISTFDEGDSIVLSCPGDREIQVASKTSAFAQRPRSGIAPSSLLEEATDWFVNNDGAVTLVTNRSSRTSPNCQ